MILIQQLTYFLWAITIAYIIHYLWKLFEKENKYNVPVNRFLKFINYLEVKRKSNIMFIVDNFWEKKKFDYRLRKYIIDIDDGDQFMRRFCNLEYDNVDIILHTEGGAIDSSDMMAKALYRYNGNISTHVPEYAFSAGTVVAISGKLHMNYNSFLGPTDPQVDYETDENSDTCSSKILMSLIKEAKKNNDFIEIDSTMYIKSQEASCLHRDNEITVRRALDKNYKNYSKEQTMTLLVSGNHPHHKPIDRDELKKLNIKASNIDNNINRLFLLFRDLRDMVLYK